MPRQETRIDNSNHISLPEVTPAEAKTPLYAVLIQVVNRLNGKLDLGSGEHNKFTGNFYGVTYDVLTPSVQDTNFTVFHKLGYRPEHCVIIRADKAAIIYDSQDVARDEQTLTLRCNVASATLKLWVF
jgi:hypothetical protein